MKRTNILILFISDGQNAYRRRGLHEGRFSEEGSLPQKPFYYMERNALTSATVKCLLALAAGCTLTGCIDDSYDLTKDVDLTMALGSEGLKMKLGSTDTIRLDDILEVDDHLHTDATHLYYLIESGNTTFDFHVNPITTSIDNALLEPSSGIMGYHDIAPEGASGAITVEKGSTFSVPDVNGSSEFNLDFTGIGDDVKWIKQVSPAADTKASIYLTLTQSNGMELAINEVKNLKLSFPDYVRFTQPVGGTLTTDAKGNHVLTFNNHTGLNTAELYLGEVTLDAIVLNGNEGKVSGGSLSTQEKEVTMEGDFRVIADKAFTMTESGQMQVQLTVSLGNRGARQSEITIANVTGQFDPEIDPDIDNIDVSSDLPDFLQDDVVTIKAANPTFKLQADLSEVPLGVHFTADLQAVKDGETLAGVTLPATGTATIAGATTSKLYFYQDANGPYDPEGVASSNKYQVPQLSSLIEKLPDYISVDAKDGHIRAQEDDATVQLGKDYSGHLDYDILVPFVFNGGLRVVYRDSVDSMNDDLKDYEAEGLLVTADIFNAIPLTLTVDADPLDVNGQVIDGITVTSATVAPAALVSDPADEAAIDAAAVTTPIELDIQLSDPALLRRVDRLRFRIDAESFNSSTDSGVLSSKQYLLVNNMRLKLKGSVVTNFN